MSYEKSTTVTWKCNYCGNTEDDTFDPVDQWDMDHEDHTEIPRYWCECGLRDVDGRVHQGHFCCIAHLQAWVLNQIPQLEKIRSDAQARWDNVRMLRRQENGHLVEAEKTPYPYPSLVPSSTPTKERPL